MIPSTLSPPHLEILTLAGVVLKGRFAVAGPGLSNVLLVAIATLIFVGDGNVMGALVSKGAASLRDANDLREGGMGMGWGNLHWCCCCCCLLMCQHLLLLLLLLLLFMLMLQL